jgi:hypothetical protein
VLVREKHYVTSEFGCRCDQFSEGTYVKSCLPESEVSSLHSSFNFANKLNAKCGPSLPFLYVAWKFHTIVVTKSFSQELGELFFPFFLLVMGLAFKLQICLVEG